MRKRIYQYLQSKAFNLIKLKSRLSTGITIEIKNKMEWIIYNDIFVEGDYDLPLQDILKTSDPAINIVDLGANVGFFNLRLAHLVSLNNSEKKFTVKAVEGSKELCGEFERRLRLSDIKPTIQIDIAHGLIGMKHGTGLLYQFNEHGLNSTSRPAGKPIETPYINLTETCRPLQEIHLLKCDIEGSELSFIQNYPDLLQKTQAIVIEFHPEFCSPASCIQHLKENGFTEITMLKDYGNCSVQYFRKAGAL